MLLQVFEHQTLRIGESVNGVVFTDTIWQTLSAFHDKHGGKYYTLIHQGVKFAQYVGVLQTASCTIEILPKTDQVVTYPSHTEAHQWRSVLVEMLRQCRLLKLEQLGTGKLDIQSGTILDLYMELFLQKIEELLQKGLPKAYFTQEANLTTLKGQLHLSKHVCVNAIHQERFYVNHQLLEANTLFNQVLVAAMQVVAQLSIQPKLTFRLQQIQAIFPAVPPRRITERDMSHLYQQRQYQQQQELLELAYLLLFHFQTDLRQGNHSIMAFMFDMNVLFEEYIFRQLQRLQSDDLSVSRQTSLPFWKRRYIRPDLLVEYKGKRMVLDTKWKVLTQESPLLEDLKQIYIYCRYFKANHGVLLYPKVGTVQQTISEPFQDRYALSEPAYGQVQFVEILDKQGRLNRGVGAEILEKLGSRNDEL